MPPSDWTIKWTACSPIGTSPSARGSHAVAFVPDTGAGFVFGGMGSDDSGEPTPLNDTFQLSTDGKSVWKQIRPQGNIPCVREGHSLNYVPGTRLVYLFGGSNDDHEFQDVYTLDPKSCQWKEVRATGTPPPARLNHAAAVVDSAIYIFGGFQDGIAIGDIHKFDTRFAKWSQPPQSGDVPPARCNHTLTAIGKKLYLIGGRAGEETLFNDVYVFDTATNKWSAPKVKGTPPTKRDFHSACAVGPDGKCILVFGGAQEIESKDIFIHYNDVYLLDTETMEWIKPAVEGHAPTERWGHIAFAADEGRSVYIFGGTGAEDDFADTALLQINYGSSSSSSAPAAAAAAPEPAAPRRAAPTASAARKATRAAPSQPAPARSAPAPAAAKFEETPKPKINYDTPTPAPASRRTVKPKIVEPVGPRNFDREERDMVQSVERIFRLIREEYQRIDEARDQLNEDRRCFEEEKAQNEELFKNQQEEMRELKEQHKQETEDWLEARKKENDATRAELAKERAQLESEQKHLQAETEKLIMDRAKLDEEEVAFKEKQTKLDTILSQMKGLG